jgi:hypothetical protein
MNESNAGQMGIHPVDTPMQLVAPPRVMPAGEIGDDVVSGLKQSVAAVMRGICASVASNVCRTCDVAALLFLPAAFCCADSLSPTVPPCPRRDVDWNVARGRCTCGAARGAILRGPC